MYMQCRVQENGSSCWPDTKTETIVYVEAVDIMRIYRLPYSSIQNGIQYSAKV